MTIKENGMKGTKFICFAVFAFAILLTGIAVADTNDKKAPEKAPPPPTCDSRVATIVGTEGGRYFDRING